MPPCSTPRAPGRRPSRRTTARSIRPTTPIYIPDSHQDPSRTPASRPSMPPSNRRPPGTSSTSPTSRVTTTTPRPTKSSPASSSSTASSNPLPNPPRHEKGGVAGSRLLLVGGEGDGPLAATLYDAGFAAAGIDATCEARMVRPAELADAVAHMRADARALCRDLGFSSGGPTPVGSLSLLVRKVELIVNATPVGNDGQAVPFPIEWVVPSHFIFDLIYQPPITPLVRGARERGARAINGLSMLLFQGLAAFEIWTGQPAPEAAMRAALERAVLGRLSS